MKLLKRMVVGLVIVFAGIQSIRPRENESHY